MIEAFGRVIALEKPGLVWVETIRQSSCGSCAAEKSCGTGVISKAMSGKRSYVKASTEITDLAEGEQVVVGVPEDFIVRGTFRLYLLPLIMLLASMLVASSIFNLGDLGAFLFGVVGLAIGFATARLIDHFTPLSKKDQPRILFRAQSSQSGNSGLVLRCDAPSV